MGVQPPVVWKADGLSFTRTTKLFSQILLYFILSYYSCHLELCVWVWWCGCVVGVCVCVCLLCVLLCVCVCVCVCRKCSSLLVAQTPGPQGRSDPLGLCVPHTQPPVALSLTHTHTHTPTHTHTTVNEAPRSVGMAGH